MGPYSHFILATKLEKQCKPEHPEDYYWGSILPDIRYLANMQRERTHFRQERFSALYTQYPHLKSFLLGYQVHCLVDEIDFTQIVGSSIPLNIMQLVRRRKFSRQQMVIFVEMYYQQSKVITRSLSGRYNEILVDLGISSEQTNVFFDAMQGYIDSHSMDSMILFFQKIGLVDDSRVKKYMYAYQTVSRRKLMKTVLMFSIKNAGLDRRVMKYAQSKINL